ncbi:MAG: GNAT family N-acetyltransferase [Myxococcales bacterium]|nr:GNAT family N-acetyltransferase [Myxococcales bacterium]
MKTDTPSRIEGRLVDLVPVSEEHLDDLLLVHRDEQVCRYLPFRPWNDRSDAEAWYSRMTRLAMARDAIQLVVCDRSTSRAVGTLVAFRFLVESGLAEVGWVLGREHWGKGLAADAVRAFLAYAFGPMGARRIEAGVIAENAASHRLAARLGFVREGVQRERYIKDGVAEDLVLYGLLAREYRATTAATG